ncbi:hypothetical protein RHMOL_Rhmol03G0038200 [Rhododendron molle]|uniref:Uncharacterized protein n=2 Tax=Rhododendron molle TaxID=49168 RepID=A0ACC0P9W1_RHOML|nr:hypothetical protein RHMOL_Rhmol03G0038000 [Rhododendron molle]KAI8562447.1 hypothetical protein RHMOL_Rhmol03G0038200 [Rhododendron molle]
MVAAYPSNYLLLLIIVVATASVAKATIPISGPVVKANITISGVKVSGVIVDGVFAYPANATIRVAGVNITLSCDRGATTIGIGALTDPTGAFKVATTTGNGTLFEESKCAVYASIASRADANVSTSLVAALRSLTIQAGVGLEVKNGDQIVVSPEIGSSIAKYTTGPFVPVA